jgi:hypothetical protein
MAAQMPRVRIKLKWNGMHEWKLIDKKVQDAFLPSTKNEWRWQGMHEWQLIDGKMRHAF